jgi:transcriptional regulator with XRE-family HTH domain
MSTDPARGQDAATRPDRPQMGSRLRAARLARSMSLRDLAGRLGVSPSLISQIETGRANPSVSTLYAMADELDLSLDELLFNDRRAPEAGTETPGTGAASGDPGTAVATAARHDPVQRAATRSRIRLASGVEWDRLTTTSEPGVEFLHVTYEVGGASSPEDAFQRHEGHEWGYILSGTLQVRIGFEEYVLAPGDAISLNSTVPHRLANIGTVPVEAIWFVIGRVPFDARMLLDEHRGAPGPDWGSDAPLPDG